jgi:hypothetical protein
MSAKPCAAAQAAFSARGSRLIAPVRRIPIFIG